MAVYKAPIAQCVHSVPICLSLYGGVTENMGDQHLDVVPL